VSKKSGHIAARIEQFRGQEHNAYYLGYFDCFNRQLFYEAHDVLEELWLADRHGPDGDYYKGLIQLAGAFVHIQKNRSGPARALFRLAENNLGKYPEFHHQLDLALVQQIISHWSAKVEGLEHPSILLAHGAPTLSLGKRLHQAAPIH
jgi:predicted metal-dependent hydrolase